MISDEELLNSRLRRIEGRLTMVEDKLSMIPVPKPQARVVDWVKGIFEDNEKSVYIFYCAAIIIASYLQGRKK